MCLTSLHPFFDSMKFSAVLLRTGSDIGASNELK